MVLFRVRYAWTCIISGCEITLKSSFKIFPSIFNTLFWSCISNIVAHWWFVAYKMYFYICLLQKTFYYCISLKCLNFFLKFTIFLSTEGSHQQHAVLFWCWWSKYNTFCPASPCPGLLHLPFYTLYVLQLFNRAYAFDVCCISLLCD